jgi:hypothetical protein
MAMMVVLDNAVSDNTYKNVLDSNNFFSPSFSNQFKIASDINEYHYENSSSRSPYMFWKGWWVEDIKTLRQQVIYEIWNKYLPFPIDEICGFEYWTRTFGPGQYINEHVDEDTFEYSSSKIFNGPRFGCVWYGADNENGGFLEIHKNKLIDGTKNILEQINIEKYKSEILDRERISYKGNRAIMFDSGHYLHNTTPSTCGERQVLVINIWTMDLQPKGITTGEFVYE